MSERTVVGGETNGRNFLHESDDGDLAIWRLMHDGPAEEATRVPGIGFGFLRWGSLADRPKENDATKGNKAAPSDADVAFGANRVLSAIETMKNGRRISYRKFKIRLVLITRCI